MHHPIYALGEYCKKGEIIDGQKRFFFIISVCLNGSMVEFNVYPVMGYFYFSKYVLGGLPVNFGHPVLCTQYIYTNNNNNNNTLYTKENSY